MARSIVRQLMVMGAFVMGAFALADGPVPVQFQVVERYAATISEGNEFAAREFLAPSVVLAEYDLFWSAVDGPKLSVVMSDQVRRMFTSSVRLEVELEAVASDGAVLITRERMWGELVPEGLAPLRSTGVYVVYGERIVGMLRVLDADQRDGLMQEALVGRWTGTAGSLRLSPEGSYRHAYAFSHLDTAPDDSGSYAVEGGVLTLVSDEATQICSPGDVGTWSLVFTSSNAMSLVQIDEMCEYPPGRGMQPGHTILLRRFTE